MGLLGKLEKLKIIAFADEKMTGKGIGTFTVPINPGKYSHKYKICYNKLQAPGSSGGSPKFNKVPSDHISFEIVFDGTGAIPSIMPGLLFGGAGTVPEQIQMFKKAVFTFNGKIHSPNFLSLSWGTLQFDCRMSSLDINYTLFKPDGDPLRARANVTFIGFESEKTRAAQAKKSSPDLTHLLTVIGNDTLPLMCYGVYQDSAPYLEVAKVNGLVNFRDLQPGTKILFPPLRNEE